jgi:hypothetical protein
LSNLLVKPGDTNQPKFRPWRGEPARKPAHRTNQSLRTTRKFVPAIVESTSSHKLRGDSEKAIFELLVNLGYEPRIEPWSFAVSLTGGKNGVFGQFTPDFCINEQDDDPRSGTFIEVTLNPDQANLDVKANKIGFVGEHYGKFVILISHKNFNEILAEPLKLVDMIADARQAEIYVAEEDCDFNLEAIHESLGAEVPERRSFAKARKIEKSAKPRKGKRPDPFKVAKPSTKPARNLDRVSERRALRKKARLLKLSVAEIKRLSAEAGPQATHWVIPDRRIIGKSGVPSIVYSNPATKRTKSSAGPQRIGDRRRNALQLSVAA